MLSSPNHSATLENNSIDNPAKLAINRLATSRMKCRLLNLVH